MNILALRILLTGKASVSILYRTQSSRLFERFLWCTESVPVWVVCKAHENCNLTIQRKQRPDIVKSIQ